MVRFNQPPKTEDCLVEGQRLVNFALDRIERPSRSVSREKREPQAGVATGLSNAASKQLGAGGDVVSLMEPNREATAPGEVVDHLPGSKSVARVEGDTRNWGGPSASRHANYENQPGKLGQPKEGEPRGLRKGVGFLSKSVGQAMSRDHTKAGTDRRSWHRQPGPYE